MSNAPRLLDSVPDGQVVIRDEIVTQLHNQLMKTVHEMNLIKKERDHWRTRALDVESRTEWGKHKRIEVERENRHLQAQVERLMERVRRAEEDYE